MKCLRHSVLWGGITLVLGLTFWQMRSPSPGFSVAEMTLLGIVQGITEFLPISSTAHLILAEQWFLRNVSGHLHSSLGIYNVVIQLGSIFAVFYLYGSRFKSMLNGALGKSSAGLRLDLKLLTAFSPAAVIGFAIGGILQRCCDSPVTLLWPMALGGVYILLFERQCVGRGKRPLENLTYRESFIIGLFQCVALFPGVSRLLMTLTTGLWLGLSPAAALEFSFLLGFLTIAAATLHQLWTSAPVLLSTIPAIFMVYGCLVAFLISLLTMRWILNYLTRNRLTFFGYYRILLAGVIALLLLTHAL